VEGDDENYQIILPAIEDWLWQDIREYE